MTVLGLPCCAPTFSNCGEWTLLSVVVRGLLIMVASLTAEQSPGTWALVAAACGLFSCSSQALEVKLSSCGTWEFLLRGMWNLRGPGVELVSPELMGGFLSTAPPGNS